MSALSVLGTGQGIGKREDSQAELFRIYKRCLVSFGGRLKGQGRRG